MSGRGGRGGGRGAPRDGGGGGRGRGGGEGRGGGGGRGGGRSEGRGGGGGRDGGRGGGRDGGRGGGRDGGGPRGGGRGGDGGRGGRGGDGGRGGGGGRGRGPDLSGMTSFQTNMLTCSLTPNFFFISVGVDCCDKNNEPIESRFRRQEIFLTAFWDDFLKTMPKAQKDDLKRCVFFQNSFFLSGREIPGLTPDKLPIVIADGTKTNGDLMTIRSIARYIAPIEFSQPWNPAVAVAPNEALFDFRCSNCMRAFPDEGSLFQHCRETGHQPVYQDTSTADARPASAEGFIMFANLALDRAMRERFAPWGRDFIDPESMTEPFDDWSGKSLGVRIYRAYRCHFNMMRKSNNESSVARLTLTVDLKAKVTRTASVLDAIWEDKPRTTAPPAKVQADAKRQWLGETVITLHDRKCFSVIDLMFGQSANSLKIPDKDISHAAYFEKKGHKLEYPAAPLMVAVQGRRKTTIYFPPEMIAGNELDIKVKEKLPMIASFTPPQRDEAMTMITKFLVPGAQKSKGAGGLLPALGIVLNADSIINATARVLPVPAIVAAGVAVPASRGENWAPLLTKAAYTVDPKQAVVLNVILFYNKQLKGSATRVYNRIRDMVNKHNGRYRLSTNCQEIEAGDFEKHYGVVEKHFSGKIPSNVFVLDFVQPYKGSLDPAYPVVKQILGKNGYVSQFVNFKTCRHNELRNEKDERKSDMILQGVARQILQKVGVQLWWVKVPESLPLPAVFIGVDVFHAPRTFDPKTKTKSARASCAAIVVQIVQNAKDGGTGFYCETFERKAGMEYELGGCLRQTVANALKHLKVKPMSCIVWRDGIGDGAIDTDAMLEIKGVREGLSGLTVAGQQAPPQKIPLAYIICQKRIDTKFLAKTSQGVFGAPSGTLVEGIQGLKYNTFYINGRAPPYSTPKPVRFITIQTDPGLQKVPLPSLTWSLCHNYANWTGPVKLPAPTQYAHKLAEQAGQMPDHGTTIDFEKYVNKLFFL